MTKSNKPPVRCDYVIEAFVSNTKNNFYVKTPQGIYTLTSFQSADTFRTDAEAQQTMKDNGLVGYTRPVRGRLMTARWKHRTK